MIRRALISVSDKTGLVEFASVLAQRGVEIVSTGGTARELAEHGISVVSISEMTGFPEILDGRVKTLHPAIFAGILFRRGVAEHRRTVEEQGIGGIDLVVVNLYPFEETVARGASIEDTTEMIDIGGPSLVRAAAKNYPDVAVVVDPRDYGVVSREIGASGTVSLATRVALMAKAFARTAAYDAAIATYVSQLAVHHESIQRHPTEFPGFYSLAGERAASLRYGENPHQGAALYKVAEKAGPSVVTSAVLQGKALSYNNILDLDAALGVVMDLTGPAAVIVKHSNPCGIGESTSLEDALRLAWECDPLSAYGGVLAFNREVDKGTALFLSSRFVEAIIAPSFTPDAREALAAKTNLRLLAWGDATGPRQGIAMRRISGGFLLQEADGNPAAEIGQAKVVTRRSPTPEELQALSFAWICVKHVKSNAILFARPGQTLAIGAGQMSRVDAVKTAVMKANLPLERSVLASDAFFPFPDGLLEGVRAGATAVVQPGGSIRDAEVIAAADEHNVAMIFTGHRHFRH